MGFPIAVLVSVIAMLYGARALAAPPSEGYTLVWADEFNGTTLNTNLWQHNRLGPRRDAINTREAVTLDGNGHLVITTSRAGDTYHTGMIDTRGRFEATFGYFECRVRMQTQVGHWSAFWLMPRKMGKEGDPKTGGTEIDIYEYLVNTPDVLHINLHWDGYGERHQSKGTRKKVPGLGEGFHVVGLEWTPEEYVFYLDGQEMWRTNQAVTHAAEYVILSAEVGSWGGHIADAQLPDRVLFDYVRVYQKPGQSAPQGQR